MQLHDLKPNKGAKKERKRVGRGTAAGQGKTAGRGVKGQGARAGGGTRLYHQGGNLPFFRRLPFMRGKGFTPINRVEYHEVNVGQLKSFEAKSNVNPESLLAAKLVKDQSRPIVLLGGGDLCWWQCGNYFPARRRIRSLNMKRSAWRYLWTAQDIRKRLLITIGLLAIYRFAAHVPVPGVNKAAISAIIEGGGAQGTLVNLLDLLSGGTVSNFSVLAMGVYPYITAQIILNLLVPIIPALQRRMEEDPREGRKWMEKWTYILAVPMAALNAVGQINLFSQFTGGVPILDNFGLSSGNALSSLAVVASMTAGTMFAIWLGELISEFGIRNQGLSLIIFAGIVSRVPVTLASIIADDQNRVIGLTFMLIFTLLTIFAIVFVQQGQRNVNTAAASQYGRHDPADLRPGVADISCHHRQLLRRLWDRMGG